MGLRERTVETRRGYDGNLFKVRVDTVEREDGVHLVREVVEHKDVVAIVPMDSKGDVLLVRQHRTPVGRQILEIPAGGVENGESHAEAAQRELQEEAGVQAARLKRLSGFYVSPGYCSEFVHLYLATGLSTRTVRCDEDESIEIVRLPLAEAGALALSGAIEDGKSIVGLLLALQQ